MKVIRGKARQLSGFSLIIFSVLLGITTSVSASEYKYIEILPPGWMQAQVVGINDSGDAVGEGNDRNGNIVGFIYNSGQYTDIIPPGGGWTWPGVINNNGDVVGDSYDGATYKGFLYSNGVCIDIIPPGYNGAAAYDINDSGDIVGNGEEIYFGPINGFLYSEGTYTTIIPSGYKDSWVQAINNNGTIVGGGYNGTTNTGFIYSNGEYTADIIPPSWFDASACDINDSGVVVGHGRDATFTEKGFIYEDGAYTELLPPEWIGIDAWSINNSGAIVGGGSKRWNNRPPYNKYYKHNYEYPQKQYLNPSTFNGFVYSNGEYTTIYPHGWIGAMASDINNSGVIVGSGWDRLVYKGFIAIPKHEYNTW